MTEFIYEPKLNFSDVLIVPKYSRVSSRREVDLTREYTFPNSNQSWTGVPIVAANMDSTGTFEMADALAKHDMSTALHKHYSIDDYVGFLGKKEEPFFNRVFYSMGITRDEYKKFKEVNKRLDNRIKMVLIDVANGYQKSFVDYIKKTRDEYPELTIMAGSVVTKEMTQQLILNGTDIVKVGIGAGSVCTTRLMTGVGYPQLSALKECGDAAHQLDGRIISDGGIQQIGDIGKAFGADSDFIMSGSFFAAHDESGGEIIERDGKKFKSYYGMSSKPAMDKHAGGVAEYRAAEGKEVLLPYRGPVEGTVKKMLGGLRSTCTYVGAARLKDLSKRTTFVMTHNQQQENKLWTGLEREEEE